MTMNTVSAVAAQDPGASRPLDLVHLSKYTLGNRSLESELLGLFRAQAGVYIDRLESAATAKEWKDAAHSLKGSSRGLGAWCLGDISEEAEAIEYDNLGARATAIHRIRAAVLTVNVFIDELMA
ncbi:MAG: Hpt domain-containing protein [Parvibaculum sp.]|nr:Hpt domain-containing protein [Parvibaculum sp.]